MLSKFKMNFNAIKPDKNKWPLCLESELGQSHAISEYLGSNFTRYVKIFHAAYLHKASNPHISHNDLNKPEAKKPTTAFEEILADSTLIGQGVPEDLCEDSDAYERVTWKRLYQEKNLPFKANANPEILREAFGRSFPSNLFGLCEYGFDCIEVKELADLLGAFGYHKVNCFYDYLSSGKLGDVDDHLDAEIQFTVDSKHLPNLISGKKPLFWSTPNYVWTDDRSFLIWSDYDLPYTFIGCNDYFYGLIQESSFEFVEVGKAAPYVFLSFDEYMK